MTKRKVEKSTTKGRDEFLTAFQRLKELRNRIQMAQVNEENAQGYLDNINEYRQLSVAQDPLIKYSGRSDKADLRSQLDTARGGTEKQQIREHMKSVEESAKKAVEEKVKKEQKNTELLNQQKGKYEEAALQSKDLLEKIKTTVQSYREASLETMNDIHKEYLELRKQINEAMKGMEEGEDKHIKNKTIDNLSHEVNRITTFKEMQPQAEHYFRSSGSDQFQELKDKLRDLSKNSPQDTKEGTFYKEQSYLLSKLNELKTLREDINSTPNKPVDLTNAVSYLNKVQSYYACFSTINKFMNKASSYQHGYIASLYGIAQGGIDLDPQTAQQQIKDLKILIKEGIKQSEQVLKDEYEKVEEAFKQHIEANDDTRIEDYENFIKLKEEFSKVIKRLPEGNQVRKLFLDKIEILSTHAIEHNKEADRLNEEKRKAIAELVEKNRKEEETQFDTKGFVGFLLQFSDQETQEGTKKLKQIMSASQKHPELMKALGNISPKEAFKQIMSGDLEKTLVRASDQSSSFTVEKQLELLEVIENLLVKENSSDPESQKAVKAVQFLRKTMNDIRNIQNGTGANLTLVGVNPKTGHTYVVNASFADILKDPVNIFTNIIENFMTKDGGLQATPFITNDIQAANLSLVLRNQEAGQLVQNVRALTQNSEYALTFTSGGVLAKGTGGNLVPPINNVADVANFVIKVSGQEGAITKLFAPNDPQLQEKFQEIQKQFANQSPQPISLENVKNITVNMGALFNTLSEVGKMKHGPIADYRNSPLFPNDQRIGTAITLINSSLNKNPSAQKMLLGGIAPPQLKVGPKVITQGPKVTTPPQLKKDPKLVIRPPLKVAPTTHQVKQVKVLSETPRQIKKILKEIIPSQPPVDKITKDGDKLTEKDRLNLDAQMAKYLGFVEQFKLIALELMREKGSNEVTRVAFETLGNLEKLAVFFENPTKESLVEFKKNLNDNLAKSTAEFKKHPDLWDRIRPIFKGIMGVIAALLIIPALIVAATIGYKNTFFKNAPPASLELDKIKGALDEVEQEIEEKMPTPTSPKQSG